MPYGMTYVEWAIDWLRWGIETPAAQNPFADPDGRFCNVGQVAPVFYLGNNFGGTSVRSCTVPVGQSILFSPGGTFCLLGFDVATEEELRPCVEEFLPIVTAQAADVDGTAMKSIETYRVITDAFSFTLPADNIFGLPAGTYKTALGGYFLIHTPLSAGHHVIHFYNEIPLAGAVFDVTYILTVR